MIALVFIALAGAYFLLQSSNQDNTAEDGVTETAPDGTSVLAYVDPPVRSSSHLGNPGDPNVAAFLALIRRSEGTSQFADPWGTFYGGAQFSDKSCHPCELRADGSRLVYPVPMPGGKFTTAAGAYQITLGTWNSLGGTAYYGSFSNAAQDQCAADLVAARDAGGYVALGMISAAQQELSGTWASFTPTNLASNNAAFANAGGALVA